MPHKYVSEDEVSYLMEMGDGSQIRVAKHGISDSVRSQIDSLKPQNMAEGGFVLAQDEQVPPSDPLAQALQFDASLPIAAAPAVSPVSGTIDSLAITQEQADLDADRILQDRVAAIRAERESKDLAEKAKREGGLRLQMDPEAEAAAPAEIGLGDQSAAEQEAAIASLSQMQGAVPQASNPQALPQNPLLGKIDQIERQFTEGYKALGESQAEANALQAKIYEEQTQNMAAAAAKYEEQFQKLSVEREQIMKDVTEGKIEPNRMWNNMDDGNKAMMAIGLVLSSIGAGMRGTQNEGLQLLDRMVTRDIEAQKADLGRKQNLLSLNMQQVGDLRQAEAMTRLQMAAGVEARIKQIAAQSGSDQAKANAQIALAKIRAEMLPLQQKIAATGVANTNPMGAMQNLPFEQAYFALPEKLRDQAVKLPGNRLGIAINQAASKKIMDSVPAMEAAETALQDLVDNSKWRLLPTAEKGRLASTARQTLLELRGIKGTGALDKGTIEVTDDIIGDPNAFFQAESRAKTADFLGRIRADKERLYRHNVIGYKPSNIQFKPVK